MTKKKFCFVIVGVVILLLIFIFQFNVKYEQQKNNELLKEKYEKLLESYFDLEQILAQTENTKRDYEKYLAENNKLIKLKFEQDDEVTVTPEDKDIISAQLMAGNVDDVTIFNLPALLYYPEKDKVRLHFYLNDPSVPTQEGLVRVEKWSLTCESPDNKKVEIQKDPNKSNYYYIDLEKKGDYVFKQSYEYLGQKFNDYFALRW